MFCVYCMFVTFGGNVWGLAFVWLSLLREVVGVCVIRWCFFVLLCLVVVVLWVYCERVCLVLVGYVVFGVCGFLTLVGCTFGCVFVLSVVWLFDMTDNCMFVCLITYRFRG